MKQEEIIRNELPNPAFARKNWRSLNGPWAFAFDPEDKYQRKGIESVVFDKTIQVPFFAPEGDELIGAIDTSSEKAFISATRPSGSIPFIVYMFLCIHYI